MDSGRKEEMYGLLPIFSESDADRILDEMNRWYTEAENDPETARKSVLEDIDWLKNEKGWLGNAIGALNSVLDLYGDILNHNDWIFLETHLFKGILVILQFINYKLAEEI